MAVEKLSLSFEPGLAERVREAAEVSGRSMSAFVAEAVEYHLKLEKKPGGSFWTGRRSTALSPKRSWPE